ncbi:hypothetical protein MBAV_006394 [Candidatus Magnetobacterium bavaricum]|uniref:Uncharacterized protein n=1 Tax=Candidatus Magnetobacterium bavaricum TaxID=29290 RepID=A0A0F3GHI9_9BACT|nr:hypothetical protein MBAV_006394 [Candidatus Magnetobacterium bavaricum]
MGAPPSCRSRSHLASLTSPARPPTSPPLSGTADPLTRRLSYPPKVYAPDFDIDIDIVVIFLLD